MTELHCPECEMVGSSIGDLRLHAFTEHPPDTGRPKEAPRASGPEVERSILRALAETVALGIGTVTTLILCLYLLAVGLDLSLDWL